MNDNYGAFAGGDYDGNAIIITTQNSNSNHDLKKLTMDATRDDEENEKVDIKNMKQLILVYNRKNSELREKESKLQMAENELKLKMSNVEAIKNKLSKKESEVLYRENALKQKEDDFISKQNDLIKRENEMRNKEKILQQQQKDIDKIFQKTMKEHDLREKVEIIVNMQQDVNDCQEQKKENNVLSEECGKYWASINAINETNRCLMESQLDKHLKARDVDFKRQGGNDQKKKQDAPVVAATKEALDDTILGRLSYAEVEVSDRQQQFEKKLKELFFKEKNLSQKAKKVDQQQAELNKLEKDLRQRESVVKENEHLLLTWKKLEAKERTLSERQIELFSMESTRNPYRAPRQNSSSSLRSEPGSKCSARNWWLF